MSLYEGGASPRPPRPRPKPPRLLKKRSVSKTKPRNKPEPHRQCPRIQRPDLQLRSKVARGTALLALTGIPAPVAALAVSTVATATAAESPLAALLAHHATRRGMGPLLLNVGGRHDLGRQVKPFPEVVETLGGQGVVVVLPRELGLEVAAGGQGLAGLDDIEVADAGLVGGLIAVALQISIRSMPSKVVVLRFGRALCLPRIVAGTQRFARTKKIGRGCGGIRRTYSFAATMTPSRKRYCPED